MPEEALGQLAHAGAAGDQDAGIVSALAAAMLSPTLPNAEQCVAGLERSEQALDPEILGAASGALRPALRLDPGCRPDHVKLVARLTERLMRLTGPLPWGHYNLAVDALFQGEFRAAAGHLIPGVTAPGGGWPPSLIGAACAVFLGEPDALSRWLAEPADDPAFTWDFRLLASISEVFGGLMGDRVPGDEAAGRFLRDPSGPLTRAVPQMSALKALLAGLINGEPDRARPAELVGCDWGRWLCGRLRHFGDDSLGTRAADGPGDGSDDALAWERLGSSQDVIALLPDAAADRLRRRLAGLAAGAADAPLWTRLVELRRGLASHDAPEHHALTADRDPVRCPWQTQDQVLWALATRDAEIECRYLEGRRALRDREHAVARRHFEDARARISGAGLATRVTALRFRALLDYWEGVTLAHLGLVSGASELLRACAGGVKAPEAHAQLGLLAVAGGDYPGAAWLLSLIPEPRPAAADYLAALLAERGGDAAGAARLLGRLEGRASSAGVYAAAGRRLQGRICEAGSDFAAAAQWYRRALTQRPHDAVAAARLARVWLRQRYDDAGQSPEPLLDRRWSALAEVGWAASLPLVRDCLDGVTAQRARNLLGGCPADPALRLLVLRSSVAAGEEAGVAEAARAWAEEDGADPRLRQAGDAIRASRLVRDFCLADGNGLSRPALAKLEYELRAAGPDPVTGFWSTVSRLLLSPVSIATAPPLPAIGDEARAAPVRLFAGLLSVFSADPDQRRAGAQGCLAALGDELPRDEFARAAVRCLAADALGDDAEFLSAYGEIETRELALPWGLAAGYLAATEARLRRGELDAIIAGVIPEPLADLAHPGVRRAMGIAYARRAVLVAERDARAALRDIGQARELLGESS